MKKICILLLCLFFLVGCTNSENKNKDKVIAELEYCGTRVINIMNSLNNLSFNNFELISQKVAINQNTEESSSSGGDSKNNTSQGTTNNSETREEISVTEMEAQTIKELAEKEINWHQLTSEIEVINSYWSVVMLDLYKENIPNDQIMSFGNILDQCTLSISNEDKENSLINLMNLYSYIPKFLDEINADESLKKIRTTQQYVLMAYVATNMDDWEYVNTSIGKAEENFLDVLNDIEYTKNREYKVNKTYMTIKDFQNSMQNKDKNLAFLKYRNIMESIDTL